MRGETAISGSMAGKILKEFARLAEIEAGSIAGQLTPREKEVLQKISEGLSNKEIGLSLCISENTVKAHVTNILKVTSPDPLSGRQRPTLDDWGYIRGTKFVQKYTKY